MDYDNAPFKNHDQFREHMKGDMGAKGWAKVPGLRSKWFWFDAKTKRCGGIYTFYNMKAVEDYMKSDLYKAMFTFPFIVKGTL